MRPSSKQWLYAGLVLVAGVGVVRLMSGPRVRKGMRVLLVGDSLAVGTSPHYAALAKDAGIDFRSLAIVGTRIDQWANSADLAKAIAEFNPQLVLISLGTNDAFMKGDVIGRQRAALEQLLTVIGDRDIVWIGPPTLPNPPSPGIITMIQDAAGSALAPRYYYFHSERLQIPRGPDNIHPTVRGYAGWAGAVWHWLS